MEKIIEIQKKNRTVVVVFATILLFALGGTAIWILMSLVFPSLPGFWKLKIAAIGAIVTIVITAIYLLIREATRTKPGLIIDVKIASSPPPASK